LTGTSSSTPAVFFSNEPNCHHCDDPRTAPEFALRFVQTDGAYEFYAYWTPPAKQA